MRLQPFATEEDVDEALRLFHVSTLEAATSGGLAGAEGFTTQEDHDMLVHIERQIKRRFAVGSQVSEHAVVQDFLKQVGGRQRGRIIARLVGGDGIDGWISVRRCKFGQT